DLVVLLLPAAEVGAVAIVDQREDAAADRDARITRMAGGSPCVAEGLDLLGLLDVQRLAALVELQRRGHEVHPEARRPRRGGVRRGAPPDPVAQTGRVRLGTEKARRVREHRPWI